MRHTKIVVLALPVAAITPYDNPDRIDIAKLAKMTRWMYATGRAVGEADKAPAVDPNFKLERCRDSTGSYCGR